VCSRLCGMNRGSEDYHRRRSLIAVNRQAPSISICIA
jgi:hypothetical protein